MSTKQLNIASVAHYTRMYGANRSLLALIDGASKYNTTFNVLVPGLGEITEELSQRGISFHVVPFSYWMASNKSRRAALSRLWTNITAVPPAVSRLKEWNTDLIHTNSSVTPIGAFCAEMLQCPHVWHIREFGDLDYNLSPDWGQRVSRLLISRSNARIAVSHAVGSHVCGGLDLPFEVIYNGVRPEFKLTNFDQDLSSVRRKSSTFTFAIVGLLHKSKGQRQALRALQQLRESGRDVQLLIVGGGPDMKNLKELAQLLKISRDVRFMGFVSDPFEVYKKADAILMCSRNEAMGRVTAEAMISRCCVIGYNSQGTKEIIDHRYNGLLYDGTLKGLYSEMAVLVDDPEYARKLGQNAFNDAKSKYTNEVYAEQVLKVFSRVV